MKPIVNRVSKSPLISIDLEEYYPSERRVILDIAPWLENKMVLKEKQFRKPLKTTIGNLIKIVM